MSAYSLKNKSPEQVSREGFITREDGNSSEINRQFELGCLVRIASALERIVAKLECRTTADAARAIVAMEKRLAKKYPLTRKAKP